MKRGDRFVHPFMFVINVYDRNQIPRNEYLVLTGSNESLPHLILYENHCPRIPTVVCLYVIFQCETGTRPGVPCKLFSTLFSEDPLFRWFYL